ncbi:MAG: hypothetical protein ACI8S6_003506, partial [Myxococcota bacterium]
MSLAWLWISGALAAHHIVRQGETVDDIAQSLGDARLSARIRDLNGLARGEEPATGSVLDLPELATAKSNQPAYVATLRGSGTMQPPNSTIQPLSVGMPLNIGSAVCTDAGSFARIRLARSVDSYEHDDISLMPGTCLIVTSTFATSGQRASLVELQQGAVSVHAATEDGGEVTILSEAGMTTGEDGGFRVTLEETAARTEAVEGPVAVIGAGVEVSLEAGEGNRVSPGEVPGPAVKLLLPGKPLRPIDRAVLFRPSFRWEADPAAFGYQIEFSTDPS